MNTFGNNGYNQGYPQNGYGQPQGYGQQYQQDPYNNGPIQPMGNGNFKFTTDKELYQS